MKRLLQKVVFSDQYTNEEKIRIIEMLIAINNDTNAFGDDDEFFKIIAIKENPEGLYICNTGSDIEVLDGDTIINLLYQKSQEKSKGKR